MLLNLETQRKNSCCIFGDEKKKTTDIFRDEKKKKLL